MNIPGSPIPALAYQPAVILALAPELGTAIHRHEPRADCHRCVMVGQRLSRAGADSNHPWAFAADARCCTYHPHLPNYMVGRALNRGGPGAQALRIRLANPSGVSAWGIEPSEQYRTRRRASTVGFGQDLAMRCPFWVGGDHACGVWQDRDAVCRTWFCKHDQGLVGTIQWTAHRKLLGHVEHAVADFLSRTGAPPTGSAAPGTQPDVQAWEAWFSWCAERVQHLSADDQTAIRDEKLTALRERAAQCADIDALELPDVVVPVIRDSALVDDRLWIYGYSRYDFIDVTPNVVHLFANLDGQTTWRQALSRSTAFIEAFHRERRQTDPDTLDQLIHELHRLDILQAPSRVLDSAVAKGATLPPRDPHEPVPDVLVPAVQKPITVGDIVWLQGEVPLGSVLAPTSIWWLFARLDGTARWRDVLADMARTHTAPLDPSLVHALFRIGALHAA